jgi:hypothetical protein
MAKFMLILNSGPSPWKDLSPEEIQRKVERYQAWGERMRASGRHVAGEKLAEDGGKLVNLRNGRLTVVDGPYSEAKEIVGGFLVLRAESDEEVVDLLRDCPMLEDYDIAIRRTDSIGCGGE